MKKLSLLILAGAAFFVAPAQTTREEVYQTPEKAGGVYYAYPVSESLNTPAPKGYKPFYISHYGRHGSRYLINDEDYSNVINVLSEAKEHNALSPLGEDVLNRLQEIWPEAQGRGGDLSPLGARQHHDIATRMYKAYPEVFTPDADITAKSTIVLRCALSMAAFCEGLKELEPALKIPREASERYMHYLNYHSPESNKFTSSKGPWREEYRKFEASHVHPDRLVSTLFNDSNYAYKHVNPEKLMWGLYWIAVDMQNMESSQSFMDLFEKEELFDLWQIGNYHNYVCDGNYAPNNGLVLGNTKPQLKNIVETAEEYIAEGKHGATLRFGHDGNLMPLTGILRLEGCYDAIENPDDIYKVFSNFRISPMAGNVQIVFFKNKENDVLVKFMLNERETSIPVATSQYPFYKWSDVKDFYNKILNE